MRRRILQVLAAGALLIPCLLLCREMLKPVPNMPVYQGKTLYEWITVLDQAAELHPANYQEVDTARAAIRAIGTNVLPFAMDDLHARITMADRVTAWLAQHATFLNIRHKNVAERWAVGVQILDLLGPIAKPCLPQLIAEATNHPGYSEEAMLAVGVAALPAFTNLLRTLQYPETGILIKAFTTTVKDGQFTAGEAAAALPCLKEISRSTNRYANQAASEAVRVIQELDSSRPLPLFPPNELRP
jgi:hypothetical protein